MKNIHVLRVVGSLGFMRGGVWIKPQNSSNYIGGTQTQSHVLTWGLSKLGVTHTVLTRSIPFHFPNSKTVTVKSCGLWGEFFFPLIAIIKSVHDHVDVIHVHMGISSYIPIAGFLISKLKKVPLVCTLNLSWRTISEFSRPRQILCNSIEQYILRNADVVIHLQPVDNSIDQKHVYIPDAIEKVFFSTKCHVAKKQYFLFVGRVSYQKGIDILLEAYEKSKLYSLGYTLILVVDSIHKLSSPLPEGVEIKSNISRKSIASLMANSHALVVPSRFEERGTVIGEALAAGTRVITSNLANIQNAYANCPSNAISYFSNNPDELSQKLIMITQSSGMNKTDIHASRNFAMNFNEAVICNQHINLYQHLLRRKLNQ